MNHYFHNLLMPLCLELVTSCAIICIGIVEMFGSIRKYVPSERRGAETS